MSTFYAQHGEDEKLLALLGDKPTGFYIDIGAWEHEVDSVTKHFYDKGWSGINVEPIPHYADALRANRPRDLTLEVGIGDERGVKPFHFIGESGLSTFDDFNGKNGAAIFERTYGRAPRTETLNVRVLTLSDVCLKAPADREIDFLKIDVEGWERQVIESGDWEMHRPTIVVVEATEPCSVTPAWDSWEPFLLNQGYEFLEFDGLNRWYRNMFA